MNTDNIVVNTQSSIRIELNCVIYFDPFNINDKRNDADIIFITHPHYDHFDVESINNIKKDNTIIVVPESMKEDIDSLGFNKKIYLSQNEETNINGINVKTISAYNINKNYHPKDNNWLGYIVNYNGISYYIAGDTDMTSESENVKCDIAFIPIGGTYTMDCIEASNLIKIINPKIVIPIHYGTIVGNKEDGNRLKELLLDTSVEVILKL